MLANNAINGRESQPGAFALGLGGIKRLEQMTQRLLIHPLSGITNRQQGIGACGQTFEIFLLPFFDHQQRGLHNQFAPRRHGIFGVNGKVHDDLFELAGIPAHGKRLLMQMVANVDVGPDGSPQKLLEVPDHFVQINGSELKRLAAAEGQKLPDKFTRFEGGVMDDFDILLALFGFTDALQQHLGVAENRGQEIVQIMRDATGKPTDRFDFLRLIELLFKLGTLLFSFFPAPDVTEENQRSRLTGKGKRHGGGLDLNGRTIQTQKPLFDRRSRLAKLVEPAHSGIDQLAAIGMNHVKNLAPEQLIRSRGSEQSERAVVQITETLAGLNEDGVRRRLHYRTEPLLAFAQGRLRFEPSGNILHGGNPVHKLPVISPDADHIHLRGKSAAIRPLHSRLVTDKSRTVNGSDIVHYRFTIFRNIETRNPDPLDLTDRPTTQASKRLVAGKHLVGLRQPYGDAVSTKPECIGPETGLLLLLDSLGNVSRNSINHPFFKRRAIPFKPSIRAVAGPVTIHKIQRTLTIQYFFNFSPGDLDIVGMNQFEEWRGKKLLFGITERFLPCLVDFGEVPVGGGDTHHIRREIEQSVELELSLFSATDIPCHAQNGRDLTGSIEHRGLLHPEPDPAFRAGNYPVFFQMLPGFQDFSILTGAQNRILRREQLLIIFADNLICPHAKKTAERLVDATVTEVRVFQN
nr:hypothetical protein [Chlorobaculum parvum]